MLRAAIARIDAGDVHVVAVSPLIVTPALGPAGRRFANAAMIVETRLDPPALLALLKGLEAAFGRRRGRRWGPRVIDLDILLWSEGRYRRGRGLAIPHLALEQRDFVLRPLANIAPEWRVGRGARTVRHSASRLARGRGN